MNAYLDKALAQNKNILNRMPGTARFLTPLLKIGHPIDLKDLQFETKYSCSYALQSEKDSAAFLRIMRRLECYIGAEVIGPNKYWEYPWVLSNLKLERGMSVLDAGCGRAAIQFLLCDLGIKVFGVDAFENVEWHGIDRKLAKKLKCNIEYKKENIDKLSFADNTFDRICCVSVLEHCRLTKAENEKLSPLTQDDHRYHIRILNELIRVLKPGGLLVMTVDFNIPRSDCFLESNVNVKNAISTKNAEIFGKRCLQVFPGEENFSPFQLIHDADIDIVNYCSTLQTSVGLTLKKKS